MPNEEPLRDRVVDERVLTRSPAYDLVELTLRRPDGVERKKSVVRHRGAVVVLPLIEQPGMTPKIVFIENERHTIGCRLLELPAGGIDAGEAPEEAAARELREETGYQASSLYPLARFYTTPGLTDELMHAFVATGLTRAGQSLQPDESLTVRVLSASDAGGRLDRGEIRDGKTVVALLTAARRGLLGL
jgi:ADP-ribose pyrophosphatase